MGAIVFRLLILIAWIAGPAAALEWQLLKPQGARPAARRRRGHPARVSRRLLELLGLEGSLLLPVILRPPTSLRGDGPFRRSYPSTDRRWGKEPCNQAGRCFVGRGLSSLPPPTRRSWL